MLNETTKYIIRGIITETPSVKTLKLSLEDYSIPSFTPGQFITVYYPESTTPEGKAYSISSAPHESTLNITVRAIGEFSNMLCSKEIGDTIDATSPYGFFYSESQTTPMVMLAAGIGITPLYSMIKHNLKTIPNRLIYLFYSNQNIQEIIFKSDLDHLKITKLYYFITRQTNLPSEFILRRMEINDIIKYTPTLSQAEYFICGSIGFVRDFWKNLKNLGVSEDKIYTESFY